MPQPFKVCSFVAGIDGWRARTGNDRRTEIGIAGLKWAAEQRTRLVVLPAGFVRGRSPEQRDAIEQVETAAVVLAGWPHLDCVGTVDLKVVLDRIRLHRLDDGPLLDLIAVIDHRWRTENGSP